MNKIVIITGLTGTGKSSLAIEIAKKYNGEIISADSVQVYKGLNIGSAKVSKVEMKEVKHHLIDVRNFNENYNVGEFVCECEKAVKDIISRGHLPIIAGGTGLYIQALVNGYSLGDSADKEFRQKLENEAKTNGNIFVWEKLNKINPERANLVHPNNLKRVIRYLELAQNQTTMLKHSFLNNYKVCMLGISEDRESIYNKLNLRVDNIIELGLENEVKGLIGQGATKEMQSMTAIGYKEWFDYFEGKVTYEKTIELIKQHTRNYCKRQLTFLKTIKGLDICNLEEAKEKIEQFIKQ